MITLLSCVSSARGRGKRPADSGHFIKNYEIEHAALAGRPKRAGHLSEYIRMRSEEITHRARLSRGVSFIRKDALIIYLPGSPKAVRESLGFILGTLGHRLRILSGSVSECAVK